MGHNNISVIPASIGALTALKILNAHRNQIISLPREIGLLCNLTTLHLTWFAEITFADTSL